MHRRNGRNGWRNHEGISRELESAGEGGGQGFEDLVAVVKKDQRLFLQ